MTAKPRISVDLVRPGLAELPFLEFQGARLFILADALHGARASYAHAGQLVSEALRTAIIPVGAMLIVLEPAVAAKYRPLKPPGPIDSGSQSRAEAVLRGIEAPVVEVGPLRIPILVDVATDLDLILTETLMPGGAPWPLRLPVLPAGSMVAMFPPELANKVRGLVARAMAALAKAQRQALHGPAV